MLRNGEMSFSVSDLYPGASFFETATLAQPEGEDQAVLNVDEKNPETNGTDMKTSITAPKLIMALGALFAFVFLADYIKGA